MQLLKDKVAVVTGSSRGIGAGIARLFAQHGAKVAIHGRDISALAAVHGEIERTGGRAVQVTGDATKLSEIEAVCGQVERQLGPVDILVANAGGNYTMPGPLESIGEEGWRLSIDANLTATFLCLKSFLPGMKERRRGNIVTISSAAARRAHPATPIPHAAAKAGIIMMTQHLATQVGPFNIRVNCIAPEIILTKNNQKRIPEAEQETLAGAHPLRRLGTVEDVGGALPRFGQCSMGHRRRPRCRRRSRHAVNFAAEASWTCENMLDVAVPAASSGAQASTRRSRNRRSIGLRASASAVPKCSRAAAGRPRQSSSWPSAAA
jgi:3-oxoacyl-[acyl-carrier protein] reductase